MPDAEWMADLLTALLPALTAGAGWAAARLGRSRKTDRVLLHTAAGGKSADRDAPLRGLR